MNFFREVDNSPARPRRAILVITLSFLLAAGIIFVYALGNTTAAPESSLIQSATATDTTADEVSATYPLATTSGNLLIAVVGSSANATINTPAGWSTAINESGLPSQAIFYKIADGTETTITGTTADTEISLGIHIYEYDHAATLDDVNSNSGVGIALSTGSIDTTEDDQLVFGAFTTTLSTSISVGGSLAPIANFGTSGLGINGRYASGADLTNTATDTITGTASSLAATWRGQIVSFTSNVPTGSFNSASQIADGSGNADISVEINHFDDEDTRLKIEFETDSDGACDGPWGGATLIGPVAADFTDSGGVPDLNNAAEYQIGSGANTTVITSSGSNTITFDWDSETDVGAVDGTQCLRLTSNDIWQDQSSAATITLDIDNIVPSITTAAISPSSGKVHFQEDVTITLDLAETGLGLDTCTANSIDVSSTLVDNGDGTYSLTYTFLPGHTTFLNGALPINCVLEDVAGNSVTALAWTDGNILASKSTFPPNPGAVIPQFHSFSISPESCTTTPTVTLNISGKNIASVLISNNAFFSGAEWEPVQGNDNWTKEWTLFDSETSGEKTVYAMVRSGSLNKSLPLTSVVTLDLEDDCLDTEAIEELVDETVEVVEEITEEVQELAEEVEETIEELVEETTETVDELLDELSTEPSEPEEIGESDSTVPGSVDTPASDGTPGSSISNPQDSEAPFSTGPVTSDSGVGTGSAGFIIPRELAEAQDILDARENATLGGTQSGTPAGVLASEAFFGNVASESSGRWLLLVQILGMSSTVLLIAVFGRQMNQKRKIAQAKPKKRKTTKKK